MLPIAGRLWIASVVLGVVGSATACASSGTVPPLQPPPVCSSGYGCPPDPGPRDFWVNGLTSDVIGQEQYPPGRDIRVIVYNVNPFAFEYRISARDARISEPSITDFFRVALGFTLPTPPTGIRTITVSGTREGARKHVSVCEQQQAALGNAGNELKNEHEEIDDSLKAAGQAAAAMDSSYHEQLKGVADPTIPADVVHERAGALHGYLAAENLVLNGTSDYLTGRVAGFSKGVVAYVNRVDQAAKADTSCDLRSVRSLANELVNASAHRQAEVTAMQAARKTANDVEAAFHAIYIDVHKLYRVLLVGPYDAPTDVTVYVTRRAAGTNVPLDTFATRRFNVGGRGRFTLAAGIATAYPLASNSYDVRRSIVTLADGTGGDTVRVVHVAEHSAFRIAPVATFNARLTDRSANGNGYLTFGVAVDHPANSFNLSYLMGFSWEFLSQRLLANVGAMSSKVTTLSPGWSEGQILPEDTVPTRSQMKLGFMAGLTFRIF